MKRFFILVLLWVVIFPAYAQTLPIEPIGDAQDPNATIKFPPPVYTLSGEVPVVGTVSVPNMTNYFIQFRPLEVGEDAEATSDQRAWFPSTLPATTPVLDGVIGIWNTQTTPDGLYEMRLVINVGGRNPIYVRVAPLRVLNDPAALSPFAVSINSANPRPPLVPTPTNIGVFASSAQATQNAISTQFASSGSNTSTTNTGTTGNTAQAGTPRVVAITDANVRRGDDTRYERVGSLITGESVGVIGISSLGTGWYYVQLPDGRRGFIAPSTVRFEGDRNSLQSITPPPPPATATPVPTATPAANSNLVVNGLDVSPKPPKCNEDFTVLINVTNTGPNSTPMGAQILVQDRHVGSNQITATGTVNIPVLAPNQGWLASVTLKVSTFYAEEHEIIANVNHNNAFFETSTTDNRMTIRYTLAQAAC